MAKFTQANRPIKVTTPLGADTLLLESFSGTEGISQMFGFQLDMLAQVTAPVAFDAILGKPITITLVQDSGSDRYFNGICRRFSQGAYVRGSEDQPMIRYQCEIVPSAWLLTRKINSKIFQQMTVPDILTAVLTGVTLSNEIQGTFEPRDYCVQYRETDFNFASRLMEEEGIYYFFTHADGAHTMVLANTPQSYKAVIDPTTIMYKRPDEATGGSSDTQERILNWVKNQEIRSGKITLWDHSPEMTGKNFESVGTIAPSVTVGTISHSQAVASNSGFEMYHYPGEFAQRFDGIAPGGAVQAANLSKITPDGTRTVKLRMEEETWPGLTTHGESKCRNFASGQKFTLDQHFDGNGEYVITKVEHSGSVEGAYTSSRGQAKLKYRNAFQCIPSSVPYRPLREHAKPVVEGSQTATVVGPAGQEIFTDKYSRIKVQFNWDRIGTKDEKSSCWIRVGTLWAGKQWGWIHIPRIGQEVIVDFLEGDPDRPIVVGSVYNDQQMPPYVLPDNMTRSGVKSNSTLGGEGYNEIRFEDKKDSEQIFIHAQKNMDIRVLNDRLEKVLNNQHTIIGFDKDGNKKGSEFQQVAVDRQVNIKNNYIEQIEGSVQLLIGMGEASDPGKIDFIMEKDLTAQLKNNAVIFVGPDGGNVDLKINAVKKELVVGDNNLHVNGAHNEKADGNYSLETGGTLAIKTAGKTSLTSGGEWATKVTGNLGQEASGDVYIKGANVVIEAGTQLTIKVGGNFVVCDSSSVSINGSTVKINSGGSAGSGSAPSPDTPTAPVDATEAAPVQAAPVVPTEADDAVTGYKSCQ